MEDYYKKRDEVNIEKIRDLADELPYYVREYLLAIQLRTTTLTRLNYMRDLKIFYLFLTRYKFKGKRMDDITIDDICLLKSTDIELFLDFLSSYTLDDKKYSCGENAKERKFSTLRSFFKYLYKSNKIPENITEKVDSPKIHDKPILYLDNHEVNSILDAAEYGSDDLSKRQNAYNKRTAIRDTAILTLFLGTGIRISECVGLNRQNINFEDNSFVVTRKGGNKTILYFSQEVADALKVYLQWLDSQAEDNPEFYKKIKSHDALFISLQGTRLTPRAVENLVKKYARVAAPLKKITPHKLRSTYGTSLYNETGDIYVVADVLGHKDINTTRKHYAAISEKMRRSVVDKVKLRSDEKETNDNLPNDDD